VLFLAYHSTPNSLFLIILPFLPSLGLFSGLSCSTQRHIACYSPSSLHPSLDLTFTAWSQHSSPVCPPIPTARQSARLPLKLTPHHHSTMPHPLTTARASMPPSQLGWLYLPTLSVSAYPPVCPPALPPPTQHFLPPQAKKWATDRFKMWRKLLLGTAVF